MDTCSFTQETCLLVIRFSQDKSSDKISSFGHLERAFQIPILVESRRRAFLVITSLLLDLKKALGWSHRWLPEQSVGHAGIPDDDVTGLVCMHNVGDCKKIPL